jgi:hypothetical protein
MSDLDYLVKPTAPSSPPPFLFGVPDGNVREFIEMMEGELEMEMKQDGHPSLSGPPHENVGEFIEMMERELKQEKLKKENDTAEFIRFIHRFTAEMDSTEMDTMEMDCNAGNPIGFIMSLATSPAYQLVMPPASPLVMPPASPLVMPPAYPLVMPPAYPLVMPPAYPLTLETEERSYNDSTKTMTCNKIQALTKKGELLQEETLTWTPRFVTRPSTKVTLSEFMKTSDNTQSDDSQKKAHAAFAVAVLRSLFENAYRYAQKLDRFKKPENKEELRLIRAALKVFGKVTTPDVQKRVNTSAKYQEWVGLKNYLAGITPAE